jgi:large subunit ribosomal protein L31
MQAGIHPNYHEVKVTCACSATWQTRSTIKGDVLRVEICANCHPFFTGKQKLVDTEGRVSLFQKKAAKSKLLQEKIATRIDAKKATPAS